MKCNFSLEKKVTVVPPEKVKKFVNSNNVAIF